MDVPNPKLKLTPGMYADVTLRIQGNTDALTVPVEAIDHSTAGATVLVVNANGEVERRKVKTGLEGPQEIEVLEGLRVGERVIVGNLSTFQPGTKN
ncbi:MAG: secretion protein HlyD [Edaphobacter sp.]|nr:secretion protein HlyD [Edaphobacter sp.]